MKPLFRGRPIENIESINSEDIPEEFSEFVPLRIDGFIYGYLVYEEDKPFIVGSIIESTDEYLSFSFWCPVQLRTIGRCTNKKDVHDEELYEGDIIQGNFPKANKCLIVWDDRRCGFFLKPLDGLGRASYNRYYRMGSNIKKEKIGDKFNNPELLNK